MIAEDYLPKCTIALYDQSLLPHLPSARGKKPYALIPAPGLGRIMGFPWWQSLTKALDAVTIFDADDAAALAASALRGGQKWVVCTAPPPALHTVQAIAQLCNGRILTTRPSALTLGRPPYNAYRLQQLSQFLALES